MGLDITLLDENDHPIKYIELKDVVHFKLMQLAQKSSLKTLLRLHDYYEEVDYNSEATLVLLKELEALMDQEIEADVLTIVKQLIDLANLALSNSRGLSAIPD